MGLITRAMELLFGQGGAVLRETAEVFRENAEARGQRDAARQKAALDQFAAEFALPRKGGFDRLIDGLNRLPRPALALGTIGLFAAAMADPAWFAERMQGIALVPEPLWWLMGAVVSFYFGARHQAKAQDFQADLARSLAAAETLRRARAAEAAPPEITPLDPTPQDRNPALDDWRRHHA